MGGVGGDNPSRTACRTKGNCRWKYKERQFAFAHHSHRTFYPVNNLPLLSEHELERLFAFFGRIEKLAIKESSFKLNRQRIAIMGIIAASWSFLKVKKTIHRMRIHTLLGYILCQKYTFISAKIFNPMYEGFFVSRIGNRILQGEYLYIYPHSSRRIEEVGECCLQSVLKEFARV